VRGAARAGLVFAALGGCAEPGLEDRSKPVVKAPIDPPVAAPPTNVGCVASDDLGGSFKEWLPGDLRLATVVNLESVDLPAAIAALQAGVQADRGLPVVASLGLGQLGLQIGLLRPQLITAGLRPKELLLLHDRAGAVVWVLRARCDLAALQATMADTWSLRARTLSEGSVAEGSGGRFAFDVAFLSEDRLALVPPGMAPQLRRWLEDGPPGVELGAAGGPTPGAVLDELQAAPIRGVVAGRSLQQGGGKTLPLVRTLRASAAGLEIDGVLTGP